MIGIVTVALAAFLLQDSPASTIGFTVAPRTIAEIDLSKLKGAYVRQLAWSPDGSQLYLQTYDANRDASVKALYHFLIPVSGGAPKDIDTAPAWAAAYWNWKSAQTAPADPSFKIEVETEKVKQSATATPMAAGLGGESSGRVGGQGVSVESAVSAAQQTQTVDVYRMHLKGEVVGEWINMPIVPGLTFGWGPKSSGLIAYGERETGKLIIMSKSGDKQKIDGTKNIVLPAWTADLRQLAYLEARGGKKYAVVIAAVSR